MPSTIEIPSNLRASEFEDAALVELANSTRASRSTGTCHDGDISRLKKAASQRTVDATQQGREARQLLIQSYNSGAITRTEVLTNRDHARNFVTSGGWIAIQTVTIIADIFMLYWNWDFDVVLSEQEATEFWKWVGVVCLVNGLYWLDMILRIYGFGVELFFSKYWNILDFFIVLLSSIGAVLRLRDQVSHINGAGVGRIARLFRVLRMVRLTSLGKRTSAGLCDCMRLITGENKRRFISAEDDFNLDLAYITPRLISMSVPASDWLNQFYRNPLSEVARFFECYHARHYLICNICPEHPYPTARFESGQVHCFDVQDHTPPMLDQFVNFFLLTAPWMSMSRDNVLAVHCRGGKGRTGSFCCAWLLYARKADDAEDALNFFAMCRTDIEHSGKIKLQGVDTPSQVRYVEYVETMLARQDAYFPLPVHFHEAIPVCLQNLCTEDLFGNDAPRQLVAVIHDRKSMQVVYQSEVATNCFTPDFKETRQWSLGDTKVCGDVRITIFDQKKYDLPNHGRPAGATGPLIAGTEPGCMFYFLFHTSFLKDGSLQIPMKGLDKANKKPKLYNKHGHVLMKFAPSSD